jgi:hypothetical protein
MPQLRHMTAAYFHHVTFTSIFADRVKFLKIPRVPLNPVPYFRTIRICLLVPLPGETISNRQKIEIKDISF